MLLYKCRTTVTPIEILSLSLRQISKNVFFHYFTSTYMYVGFSPNLQENIQYVVLTSSKRYTGGGHNN